MTEVTQEALILAGGLGTRLRAAVSDRPKPMAEVDGRPFVTFLLDQLVRFEYRRAILCVGHLGQFVPPVLGEQHGPLQLVYSFESTPLGTGGALRNALTLVHGPNVLAMNGDSFCDIDLAGLDRSHRANRGAATIAVLQRDDRRQSGAVTVDASGRAVRFESRPVVPTPGLINTGIYMLCRDTLESIPQGRKYSLEDDLFPALATQGRLFAYRVEARFIDIGTPETYGDAPTFFANDT